MIRKLYQWKLIDFNECMVTRYCHNCGKKVIFRDSGKRRRNANGKTIYEYAIYKCDNDHTWNLLIDKTKASDKKYCNETDESIPEVSSYEKLDLMIQKNQCTEEIEIILEEVKGKWRLDKLLGDRIIDMSRRKICELIDKGIILLDGRAAVQDSILKKNQRITILLNYFD